MRASIAVTLGAMALLWAGASFALGTSFGVRAGYGPGFGTEGLEEATINGLMVGPALKIDLVAVAIEVDLLYSQTTAEQGSVESVSSDLSIPVIAQIGLPLVPGLASLKLGAGLEARYHLSAEVNGEEVKDDQTEDTVFYLPITVGVGLNAGLASLGLDIRYLHQLTESVKDSDDRVHQLMFMAGVFF